MPRVTRQGCGSPGFSLIEVLLALAITAMISVIAYTGLSTAVSARDSLLAEEERHRQLMLFFSLFGRDIRHAAPRPVRNEYDDEEPAVRATEGLDILLELTRRGWDNPAAQPRSDLQRVVWRIEDEVIYRGVYQTLDRGGDLPPVETAILENVEALSVRFLGHEQTDPSLDAWRENWSTDGDEGIPLAVEVELEIEGWGSVRRVFLPAGTEGGDGG